MKGKLLIMIMFLSLLLISGCSKNNSKPIITVNSTFQTVYELNSEEPNWLNAVTVNDKKDGILKLSQSNVDTSNVNMNTIGNFEVIYKVKNSLNETTTFKLPITIVEQNVEITLGLAHHIVISSTGHVYAYGLNCYGQLGDGTLGNKNTPTDITQNFNLQSNERVKKVSSYGNFNLALSSSGRVFSWGHNDYGQLGDGTKTDRDIPIDITQNFNLQATDKIVKIFTSYEHAFVLTEKGHVYGWGRNISGVLGITNPDTTTPVEITFNLPSGEKIIDVMTDMYNNIALSSTGKAYFWGTNYGNTIDFTPVELNFNLKSGESILKIVCGKTKDYATLSNHYFAITSLGRVFAWGVNINGQLGDGTTNFKMMPIEITENFKLKTGEVITEIEATRNYNFAISSFGRVFAWGANENGQLGDGTTIDKLIPVDITHNFKLKSGESIIEIEVNDQIFAISSLGKVYAWGVNEQGRLGDGTTGNQTKPEEITQYFNLQSKEEIIKVLEVSDNISAISSTGNIFTWGVNYYGQLGDGSIETKNTPEEISIN